LSALAQPLSPCPCGHTINFEISVYFCSKRCGCPHLKNSPCPTNVRTGQTPLTENIFYGQLLGRNIGIIFQQSVIWSFSNTYSSIKAVLFNFFLTRHTNRFKYSFICQGTSIRRQRRDLFGLRVKLPLVTTSLTTQR